jgi:menaquinone-dependent protoporphyrinogen oxidase
MPGKVLVAYATKYGSTAEIAGAIGEALRGEGLEADVLSVKEVGSVEPYRAVVIGSPIYMGRLLSDAVRFAKRHRNALCGRPTAAFIVGSSLKEKTDENIEKAQATLNAIRPYVEISEIGLFAGTFDPGKMPLIGILVRLGKVRAEDARDWEVIRAWGKSLPGKLGIS